MRPYAKITAAKELLEWLDAKGMLSTVMDRDSIVDFWINETFIECDVAVAHGPGHQSITPCENPYRDHTQHYNSVGEWSDEDISEQTYTKYNYELPPGKTNDDFVPISEMIKTPRITYRLAFTPY